MGGIQENFGDYFEYIKVVAYAQEIENAKLSVTADDGMVIELKNKYVFENPRVTLDGGNDDDGSDADDMPFMEMEIAHKLRVEFSNYSNEVIDFTVSSVSSNIVNYGIYYQCEAELQSDEEDRMKLLNLINDHYIQDVNGAQT
jgi:hypothetical protein